MELSKSHFSFAQRLLRRLITKPAHTTPSESASSPPFQGLHRGPQPTLQTYNAARKVADFSTSCAAACKCNILVDSSLTCSFSLWIWALSSEATTDGGRGGCPSVVRRPAPRVGTSRIIGDTSSHRKMSCEINIKPLFGFGPTSFQRGWNNTPAAV